MTDELSKPMADSQDGEVATMRRELARAHAAMQWFATVRNAIVNILAVAHALSDVWLSGEQVTARAVADLLGWHAEHSALAVREWLRPLQTGPCPLVLEDLRPNIETGES